jgi:hypothetical protein
MRALSRTGRFLDVGSAEAALSADFEGDVMRERMVAVRDTLIVLGLQLLFRAVMLLRRWNY